MDPPERANLQPSLTYLTHQALQYNLISSFRPSSHQRTPCFGAQHATHLVWTKHHAWLAELRHFDTVQWWAEAAMDIAGEHLTFLPLQAATRSSAARGMRRGWATLAGYLGLQFTVVWRLDRPWISSLLEVGALDPPLDLALQVQQEEV